jgi:ABC-2 type transport system permease protein
VRFAGPDAAPDGSAEPAAQAAAASAAGAYLRTVGAVAEVEWHRARREPSVLLTRVAQPLLWLLVFGAAVSRVPALGPPGVDYQAFLVPGVIAQSVLFIAIFSGLGIIWERDLGITQRLVVAPVARSAVVLGKALGAGLRAVLQVLLVLGVVAVAGIPLRWGVLSVAGVLLTVVLGAMFFSCVSMVIASLARSREHFVGVGQLVTLPLFFASTALYPLSVMPRWLRAVAEVNPLTSVVELLRRLLLGTGSGQLLVDVTVLVAGTALAVAVVSVAYPRRVS